MTTKAQEQCAMNQHLNITQQEAEAQGFVVDTTRYPWVAYKGPTFRPDEWHTIDTPRYNPQPTTQEQP